VEQVIEAANRSDGFGLARSALTQRDREAVARMSEFQIIWTAGVLTAVPGVQKMPESQPQVDADFVNIVFHGSSTAHCKKINWIAPMLCWL
jgi:hypothetical protein